MFSSIKSFFAPSFELLSWTDVKNIIRESVTTSRRSFWVYFEMFWWAWVLSLGFGIGYFKFARALGVARPAGVLNFWVMSKGFFGFLSALIFILVIVVIYFAQFLIVRSKSPEEIGFARLKDQIYSHYPFLIIQPFLFALYSLTAITGDFYAFMFLETEGSWRELGKSFLRGAKLGIKLIPLRIAIFTCLIALLTAPVAFFSFWGVGVWFLAQKSVFLAWCAGIPLAGTVVWGLLWGIPRFLFFSLSMQSVLYDKIKEFFLD